MLLREAFNIDSNMTSSVEVPITMTNS
jgi:hypothetical protein